MTYVGGPLANSLFLNKKSTSYAHSLAQESAKGMCPQPMFPTSEPYIRKSDRGGLHCCTNAHIPKLVRKRGVGDVN